ncbi:MAG TPA: PRC-barrel domain-containing protein [Bacteroidales bacterium]|nr:PRC-barrel domain-containing protein [Bacteroidales bacterium]
MLSSAKEIRKFELNGLDEEVGGIKEFYFDDKFWTIRYLVASTGSWLNKRQVLISPYFIGNIDHELEFINVNLTKKEIEGSPSIDTDKPVSRQFEESYYSYYGAPVYWGGPSVWGPVPSIVHDRNMWRDIKPRENTWDPNLRSSKDVTGHTIQAKDDKIGHVDDFIIDEESWTIRYLVIDTKDWLPGKKVLISPEWIDRISWNDSKVFVNLTTDSIKNAPEFDEDEVVSREYESRLYNHYKRQGYWLGEPVTSEFSESSGSRKHTGSRIR